MPAPEPTPDPSLNRKQAANFLTQLGFPISSKTLSNWRWNPTRFANSTAGPPFYKTDWRTVYYKQSDLIAWVADKVVRVE